MAAKIDPIRSRYYDPLERAEIWSDWLFYLTAAVSIAVVLIDKEAHAMAYGALQTVFVVLALSSGLLGLCMRLYWAPRAQERRIADFLSSAFRVELTSERTTSYYNSKAGDPARRTALQVLENCFFTKHVARMMCMRSRAVVAIYGVVWVALVVNRETSIDVVVWLCQFVFGEAILSGLVRLEWLRARAERVFEAVFRQWKSAATDGPYFLASSINALVEYESHKATSGITLSSKLFEKNNVRLSQEWENIRGELEGN